MTEPMTDEHNTIADEAYPPDWKHCVIHLNPKTGEMHSDGDHSVREWIQERLEDGRPTAWQWGVWWVFWALILVVTIVLLLLEGQGVL